MIGLTEIQKVLKGIWNPEISQWIFKQDMVSSKLCYGGIGLFGIDKIVEVEGRFH